MKQYRAAKPAIGTDLSHGCRSRYSAFVFTKIKIAILVPDNLSPIRLLPTSSFGEIM